MRIRRGRAEDADRLAVLAIQVWLHTYATEGISAEIARYVLSELTPQRYGVTLGAPATPVLVAESDAGLVGFAVVRLGVPCPAGTGATAELQTLYVQEHFTGRGAGTSLLRAAEALACGQGDRAFWLTVNAQNARAIAFYERHGYSSAGIDDFVLGDRRHQNLVLAGPGASGQPLPSP